MRILHTPTNTGGHPGGLSRGERALGLQSDVVVFEPNPFGFAVDRSLYRDGPLWRSIPGRLAFLQEAVRTYDVFHFNFGSTILPAWGLPYPVDELALLRRLGKIVLATFQGDDARPPEHWSFPPAPEARSGIERRRRHARERLLRHAHRVFYVSPDMRPWLPGAVLTLNANLDPRDVTPSPPAVDGPIRIVHGPSHRGVKGTDAVLAAVAAVQAVDDRVVLDLVEGVPHAEAMRRIAAADIAIDQLRVGWYGGFAIEAMALGKPTLCYIRDALPGDNPFAGELPIVNTSETTLEADLHALIARRGQWREIGAASRRFVERHHDPRAVARRVLDGLVQIPGESPPAAARWTVPTSL